MQPKDDAVKIATMMSAELLAAFKEHEHIGD